MQASSEEEALPDYGDPYEDTFASVPSVRRRSGASAKKTQPELGANRPARVPRFGALLRRPANAKRRSRNQQRFRAWVFTLNNPTADDNLTCALRDGIKAFGPYCRYIVYQLERSASGTIHYQGYLEVLRPCGLADIKSIVGQRAYCDRRRSRSAKKAIAYATKSETREKGPFEFGTPAQQGKRTDIIEFRDAIKRGCIDKRKLLDDHVGVMARYPRMYDLCCQAYYEDGWRDVESILLIGDTGLGKTRWVYDNWAKDGDFYRLPAVTTSIWFDGYTGQAYALIDDFAGAASKISLSLLLQCLDGYMHRMPCKGGFVNWKPKHIAVTTNVSPKYWYRYKGRENQYQALARRFKTVMEFVTVGDTVVVEKCTGIEYFNQ